MGTPNGIKRKTAGVVTSLFYFEQNDGSRIELEASGYFEPEQQATETDPYHAPWITLERITNEQGRNVAVFQELEDAAKEALWKEIR